MILSDADIRERLRRGDLRIQPLSDPDTQIQAAWVDLTLGEEFRVFKEMTTPYVDVRDVPKGYTELVRVREGEEFVLHPGSFVLACTREVVRIPDDLAACVDGRSSLGRLGVAFEYEGPSIELIGVLEVRSGKMSFRYADGELTSDPKLLNREIHVVDCSTLEDAVWRLFTPLRKTKFTDELHSSRGLTSKAAKTLTSMGVLSERDVEVINRAWDVI